MTLLKAHNIHKSWNKNVILDSVSIELVSGGLYQLQAQNGKGKTTLLKICAGLLTPERGEVKCDFSKSWCSSHGSGEIPRLTGYENIELMKKIFKTKEDRIDTWRDLISFNEALETEYGKCSDGMKMLISLYISTLAGADILFWDEPFAHLSFENSNQILSSWDSYTGAKALIFSSHESLKNFSGEVISL